MRIFTKKRAKPYNEIGKRLGKTERSADAVEWKQRLSNLLCVKSIVTITLTITFCVLECCGSLSQDYMTIYTAVIGFYFGTQSKKDEDV